MKSKLIIKYIVLAGITFSFKISSLEILSSNDTLKKAIQTLENLHEFQDLVKTVERDGPIRIQMEDLENASFDAYWESHTRKIQVNLSRNKDFGTLVASILFELHNAKTDKHFNSLYKMAMNGQISKEAYVENVERMEHGNALSTSNLLEKGIQLGIFPKTASWPILRDFDDHYKLQQIRKHSHFLADNYTSFAHPQQKNRPYKGTLPNIPDDEKENFVRYLKIKNDLLSPSKEKQMTALIALKQEFKKVDQFNFATNSRELMTIQRKINLMDIVFSKIEIYQEFINQSNGYAKLKKTTSY